GGMAVVARPVRWARLPRPRGDRRRAVAGSHNHRLERAPRTSSQCSCHRQHRCQGPVRERDRVPREAAVTTGERMPYLVDEAQREARAAIEAMKAAAPRARAIHARAELIRHMFTTARKVGHLPRDAAVEAVVGEWMKAWHLTPDVYAAVAADMRSFTDAFCAFAETAAPETDERLRSAVAALERALRRAGTTLGNQMGWRSECAHGWWELVV